MYRPPLLFDLAVLYRAVAFKADAVLDPAEAETMRELLQDWLPAGDRTSLDHVLGEAARVDRGLISLALLLERVAEGLSASARARVLADLRRIAAADGRVTKGEQTLLSLVERAFDG